MSVTSRISLLMLLAGWLSTGQAAIREIEQAFELTPAQVQLPSRPDAQLTIRPCAECRIVALRVTPATQWHAGLGKKQLAGQAAVLELLRRAGADPQTLVHVYYEPQTLRVKRIVLDLRRGATTR
ncbi:MAG: hypothetical protein JNJ67_07045 [Chromatiales bacterium]|jgi:hypothetical protein|nr:hypothetical protein [Chromatiales bacterium]